MAQVHAFAFDHVGAKLVGIASRTLAKAEALATDYADCQVFRDPVEMMRATEPDIVVVTVSVLAIADVVRALLPTAATLLIEKPAGHTFEVASQLALELQSAQAKAYVALNRRHYASTRWLADQLPAGPRVIKVQDQQSAARAREVGHPEEVVQNWHYANSIHLVDLVRCFARGEVQELAVHRRPGSEGGILLATVEFTSGDFGIYEAVWEAPGPWAVTVTTGPVRGLMQPLESAVIQRLGERETMAMPESTEAGKPGLVEQARQTLAAWQNQPHTLPTAQETLASMDLARLFYGR